MENLIKATVMSVDAQAGTAVLNINELTPAQIRVDLMVGGDKLKAFRKLRPDSEIDVTIVSRPNTGDGWIVVRQYDAEKETANMAAAKLATGTIVTGTVVSVNAKGANIVSEGAKIYVPVEQISGRQNGLRALRSGRSISVQITGRRLNHSQGTVLFASQQLADLAQKQQVAIGTLQDAVKTHEPFKVRIKSVKPYGAVIHLLDGIHGRLNKEQMDKETRRLFDSKELPPGTVVDVEIESVRFNEGWRVLLNQKLVPVRKLHGEISEETAAREGQICNFVDGPALLANPAVRTFRQAIVKIDGVFGLINCWEIEPGLVLRKGWEVKVYSTGIDTRRAQLRLKVASTVA